MLYFTKGIAWRGKSIKTIGIQMFTVCDFTGTLECPICSDLDGVMTLHDIIGTTNMGIGGIPSLSMTNDKDALSSFVERVNGIAASLGEHGFKFTYHNHSFEFKRLDGMTVMDCLIEGFDPQNVSFVLDTYWI